MSFLHRRWSLVVERGKEAGNAAAYTAAGLGGGGLLAILADHFNWISLFR